MSAKRKRIQQIQQVVQVVDNTIPFERYKRRPVNIIPRNLKQEEYLDLLYNESKHIVFSTGPAGTGKTLFAVLAGIKALKEQRTDKLILTRPAVGVEDESHGFLPGDLNSKMEPWTRPLFDIIFEYYDTKEVTRMLDEKIIEISPLAFMRGRTFKNAWIIADEMQNATPSQMKMLLTRLGDNSKIVVTGDIDQTDKKHGDNGLADFKVLVRDFGKSKYVAGVEFGYKDIERHPAVAEILAIYKDTGSV
jgi:phosphate starvation-inducible protein PhoH and related proteins